MDESPWLLSLAPPSSKLMVSIPTPLPKWQLTIVYAVQISEPISATVVYPFLPDFVRKTGITGGDETKTGYYSGIIGSAFFLAECLSVFHWGRASDSYGRRPVLLWGPLGLAIALLGFGLSSNFWWLVVLRAFQGIFNGNIGVSKTILAELTDSTNIGSAFAIMPIMWGVGNAIGPVMGGLLADPAERWPDSFGKIWVFREYPYLLPCGVAALFSFLIFVCAAISLQETHPTKKKHLKTMMDEETTPLNGTETTTYSSSALGAREMEHNPPSMREIITPTVIRTIVNYVLLAFLSMSYTVLIPLMYSTSIPAGGLGFTPYKIGVVLASWGFVNAVLQVCSMSTLLRRYGSRTIYISSAILLSVGFVAFGLESFFARLSGKVDAVVLALMCIQFSSMFALSAGYASIQILIVQSVTNSLGLGSVNGLAQMVASGVRGLAPTLTSSLFSATLEHNLLGGFFVYAFILAISLVSIRLSFIIPKSTPG